jgi:hypothetical protein
VLSSVIDEGKNPAAKVKVFRQVRAGLALYIAILQLRLSSKYIFAANHLIYEELLPDAAGLFIYPDSKRTTNQNI